MTIEISIHLGDLKVRRGKMCLFMQHMNLIWCKYINENDNAIVYVKIIKKTALRGCHFLKKITLQQNL